ncbi:ArsR family transcriptional regulator [Idiomarina tyrosinivorans]|uniref:ArsR family transcriptional regulator n=1 Tax=Idiomarina tyrosinivorans TaxID=1445662 RepID=A0A432ZUE8_9GAMM|nr:autorepressor SdpR family transcription factor [Idiomarina tyrosinivorans]RUO81537.1 ArsR family transcriptional regulator [Idiomarina tyrosinivorans]
MQQQSVFKALADPTRRQLLQRLRKGSLSAGELAETVDVTSASVSHHLSILQQADLVRVKRDGQRRIYSVNTTVFEDVAAMMYDLFGNNEKL